MALEERLVAGPGRLVVGVFFARVRPTAIHQHSIHLVQWIATLDGVLKLDFDTAIPGHGPVLTKDNVRTFRQNLVTLRQRMTEVVKAGARKEDLGKRLKRDDLGWPFPPERLNELWDEFGGGK